MKSLLSEFRRRGVIRAAAVYVAVAWGATEILAFLIDAFWPASDGTVAKQYLAAAFVAGFPVAMYLAWSRDLGLRGRRILIATTLALFTGGVLVWLTTEPPVATNQDIRVRPLDPSGIAVLPLANLSGDPEQAYFVAGMHEALIADLARIRALKVISRTSTRHYENSEKPLPRIAAELGVASLIEGSVYRVGDQVRITVQLIDGRTDEHLWAGSYERSLANVLRLQSEVARDIAGRIEVVLTPDEERRLAAAGAVDPHAYELYLKGRFHWAQLTEEDLRLALQYFEAAIERDPDYALAYVGHADATATLGHIGIVPAAEVFPSAKRQVEHALALDETLAEAHDLLARILFAFEWDWTGAGIGFERALELRPNYPDVYVVYSQYLAITGQWDRVLPTVLKGLELDPLSSWFRHEHANRLLWLGRLEDAAAKTRQLLAAQPDNMPAQRDLWIAEHLQGADADAVAAAQAYFRLRGAPEVAVRIGSGYDEGGYAAAMLSAVQTLTSDAGLAHSGPLELAELYAHAGQLDLAMTSLEEALRSRESGLVYATVNPLYEPLWTDTRFVALREAMELPPGNPVGRELATAD